VTLGELSVVFLLGLALAAAPGALNVESLRRGLRHGFLPALAVQVGALLGDALWVGVATSASAVGLRSSLAGPGCMLLGGTALLWTASQVLRPLDGPAPGRVRHRGGLAMGAVLALSSPLTVVFWAAVQGLVRDHLGRAATATELALVGGAYVLSVLVWAVGLAAVAAWGRPLVTSRSGRVLHVCCAVLLASWGLQLLGRAASALG
jgi:chemosensory pili system protein ChpE